MNLIPMASFLPEFILLFAAMIVLLMGVSEFGRNRNALAGATMAALVFAFFAAAGALSPEQAEPIPGLIVTPLTSYVRIVGLVTAMLLVLLSWSRPAEDERGEYFCMILCSLLGLLLLASAADLVVLFFAVELVSVPTYVLVALSRQDARASESAVKYFFLGSLSAAILAYGLALLYGAAGTTSLVVGEMLPGGQSPYAGALGTLGLFLAFAGLSFKIAAFPFHGYVADVYEGASSPVTAFLGFVPKLAGFTAMIQLMNVIHWCPKAELQIAIAIVALLTMTVGNVLALMQRNLKRMMAYSGVAHSGYMLVGLLVGPVLGVGALRDGVAAMLFYMAVYGVMNLGVFAAMGMLTYRGREVENLDEISGLARMSPLAGVALAACVFSLMGFPPTAGLLGKFYIFGGAFSYLDSDPMYPVLIELAIVGVVNSAIGAAYYLRIVSTAWQRSSVEGSALSGLAASRAGLFAAGLIVVAVFVRPSTVMNLARGATPAATSGRMAANADREAEPRAFAELRP